MPDPDSVNVTETSLIQAAGQLAGSPGVPQLVQRALFDLADAFARKLQVGANFSESLRLAVRQGRSGAPRSAALSASSCSSSRYSCSSRDFRISASSSGVRLCPAARPASFRSCHRPQSAASSETSDGGPWIISSTSASDIPKLREISSTLGLCPSSCVSRETLV